MAVDIRNDRAYRYDDLADFPDDNLRREIMDGELVVTPAPGPPHQTVVLELGARLLAWTRQHGGRVFVAPLDVFFAEDNVVEPDVLFLRPEHTDRVEERAERIERYRLEGDRYGQPELLGRGDELASAQVPGFAVLVDELLATVDG